MKRPAAGTNAIGRYLERRKMRRIWGAVSSALMPPPARAFASFGPNAMIMPPARVEGAEFITIGRGVKIHEHVWLMAVPQPGMPPPRLVLGDRALLGRFVKIVAIGEVIIGEDCMLADNTYISDTHYRYDDPTMPIGEQGLAPSRPVVLGPACHVGFRSTIRPGVTLAESVHVGPGSVIYDDFPARTVVFGDPARIVRRYDPAIGEWVFARRDGESPAEEK